MKALSVYPIWAARIAAGEKTIEVRSWATRYRGPLLICATKRPNPHKLPAGVAVCTVELADVRPMTQADEEAAGVALIEGAYAWVLRDARRIDSFAIKGRQKLFNVRLAKRAVAA